MAGMEPHGTQSEIDYWTSVRDYYLAGDNDPDEVAEAERHLADLNG